MVAILIDPPTKQGFVCTSIIYNHYWFVSLNGSNPPPLDTLVNTTHVEPFRRYYTYQNSTLETYPRIFQ